MPKISPSLLDKYLRNDCTEQEKQQVEAWYASLQNNPDYLTSLPQAEQRQLQENTFLAIQGRISTGTEPVIRRLSWGWTAWLAASILLAIGVYVTYRDSAGQITAFQQSKTQQANQPTVADAVHFINKQARPIVHKLPDGSSVWMHVGASITYPKQFERDNRRVAFSGEGFFDVTKDKTRPFFIQSGEIDIKVLGTSFNVKALNSSKVFQVAVVTGRVQVSAPDHTQKKQQVILKPQQQAIFEINSKRLVATSVPVLTRKAIYEPITIVFDNTPLNQVLAKLQKRFDVTFRLINPKLSSCLLNADFEHQALPDIMEMLCAALDVTYTMSGNTIVLDGTPCE
ncbi:FecR family protein [Spirosoma sp. BT702]|uniref:FecR family protein n=1 Tax=Spirosoma profusum TaxID=2771354 RepID=A0A927ARN3_9BACT|nr:FecR domain-containing protein [Spirosoma profusum]MBD2700020.1 FecR family protein [Spirosoma profusum]